MNSNKIIKFAPDNNNHFGVYLKTLTKNQNIFKDEQFVYLNPQKVNLAEINIVKKNLNEFKEKYTPLIRLEI